MEILATIKRLTDAGARRAAQLQDLRQKRADLEGEYLTAIGADDDAAATKARTKIAKVDDEIREKEAAIEAAAQLAAQAERREADAVRDARRAEHDKDVQALVARAIEMDELVNGEVAELWLDIERLFTKARLSAQGAGVDFLDVHGTKPHSLWRRMWQRFTQRTGRNFNDVSGARESITLQSIREIFAVKEEEVQQ